MIETLAALLESARAAGNHIYALADAAQDNALPGAISSARTPSRCMLPGAQGSSVEKAAPHLVDMTDANIDEVPWQWLVKRAPLQPCASLLASASPLDELVQHLQRFIDVELPDRTHMALAFWDPMILAGLIGSNEDPTLHVRGPIFNASQRVIFLAPIKGAWYWDRAGALRALPVPKELTMPASGEQGVLPLRLHPEQIDQLVEASMPDQIWHYIRENKPDILLGHSDFDQYRLISQQLMHARGYGLDGMRDLVNYCSLAFALGIDFDRDAKAAALLTQVKAKTMSFDTFMEQLAEAYAEPDAY